MLTISPYSVTNQIKLPESRIGWSEYNIRILTLYLKNVRSNWNPDFIICPAPDDLIVGNSFYRGYVSKKTMGILMASPQGEIAEHMSILKNKPEGKALLIGLQSERLKKIESQLLKRFPDIKIKTTPLFQETVKGLPDEIFERMNLMSLESKDLENKSGDQLKFFSNEIFEKLKNDPQIELYRNELLQALNEPQYQTKIANIQPCVVNLTWDDLGKKIINLALKIIRSGYKPDVSLYIGSGGNYVGKVLSTLLGTVDASIMATSYNEKGERGKLTLAPHVSIFTSDSLKGRILLIDDLVDSGITLEETKKLIKDRFKPESVKTAVIFKKMTTIVDPDFYTEEADKRWIFMPDEVFERFNLKHVKPESLIGLSDDNITKLALGIFESQIIDPRINISDETIEKLLLEVS